LNYFQQALCGSISDGSEVPQDTLATVLGDTGLPEKEHLQLEKCFHSQMTLLHSLYGTGLVQ